MKKISLILTLVLVFFTATAQTTPPQYTQLSRFLLHCTVRLEVERTDHSGITGTGFIYSFLSDNTNYSDEMPALVTCWHMVQGGSIARFTLAQRPGEGTSKKVEQFTVYVTNFEEMCIRDPDTNIDLAIMPFAPILQGLLSKYPGFNPNLTKIESSYLPSEEDLQSAGVFQEVKFIGYPNGIWDHVNVLPIVRRGMTATDMTTDYNGQPKFLIDASVYPGSSGSPVFIAEEGSYGPLHGPSSLKLLGIVSATPIYTAEGKVEIVPIPTAFEMKSKSDLPLNLGIVIKSSRLNDFYPVLDEFRRKEIERANKYGVTTTTTNSTAR